MAQRMGKSPVAGISDRQWQVLDILWRRPHSSLREVQALLNAELAGVGAGRCLAFTTVATFVNRLLAKGLIRISRRRPDTPSPLPTRRGVRTRGRPPQEGVQRYAATRSREQLLGQEVARAVQSAADPVRLAVELLETMGLSDADRAEVLRRLAGGGDRAPG